MVRKPEHYPWSSYPMFKDLNTPQPVFLNVNYVLDYYIGTVEEKRQKYCGFVDP